MLGQVQRPQTYEALSCLHTVDSEIAYNSRSLDLRTSSLGFLFFLKIFLLPLELKKYRPTFFYIRETGFVFGDC